MLWVAAPVETQTILIKQKNTLHKPLKETVWFAWRKEENCYLQAASLKSNGVAWSAC